MRRIRPGQDAHADGHAECSTQHEGQKFFPVQRAAQLPDRVALHDLAEGDDQRRRLQRCEEVEPDRGGDQAKGESGKARDQRAREGRQK
jgi:hypothetical protein